MMGKKAILFDFFGTLMGTTSPENSAIKYFKKDKTIHGNVQRAFCGANLKDGNFEKILAQNFYSESNSSWNGYLENCCNSLDIENNWDNKNKINEIIYSELIDKALRWSPNQRDETLEQLSSRGYELTIASNAYPPTLDFILEYTNLSNWISKDNMFMSYSLGKIKADEEFYLTILKNLEVSPKNAIMIGDSWTSDI